VQIYIKEGVEFRSAQKHVAKENFETVKPKIKEILGAVAEGFPIKQGLKLQNHSSHVCNAHSCRRISNKTRIETVFLHL